MSKGTTPHTSLTDQQEPSGNRRFHLAFWAAADKGLPMLYGVAVVALVLHRLSKPEWSTWVVFQTLFLSIILFGDFLLLQPMAKLSSEHLAEDRPIITAGSALFIATSLLLATPFSLFPGPFSDLLKSGDLGRQAFVWMVPTVAATVLRNISIRVLQIDYRIIRIFILDLVYFGGFVVLIALGAHSNGLHTTMDMVEYNLIALIASSVVGILLCGRDVIPQFSGSRNATNSIVQLGTHQGGTGLMTIIQQNVDVVIVSGTSGSIANGIYSTARIFYRLFEALREAGQLLLIPATSNANSRNDRAKVEDISVLATAALVALLYPLVILLIFLYPLVIPIILPDYISTVSVFQWLIASGFAMPFIIVPSSVLLGIGKTRELFRGMAAGSAILVVTGLILTYVLGESGMAIGVLLGNLTIATLLTRQMNRHIDFSFRSVLKRSRSFGTLARKRMKDIRNSFGKGPQP